MSTKRGRKPKNGTAMTAAERKRNQRQRKKEAKKILPKWLQVRLRLWGLVQKEFIFDDVDELAHALKALSIALFTANCLRIEPKKVFPDWWYLLQAYVSPGSVSPERQELIDLLYEELQDYSFENSIEDYSLRKGTRLASLICDITGSHESEAEETDESEAKP
jgi:hypothetical protein